MAIPDIGKHEYELRKSGLSWKEIADKLGQNVCNVYPRYRAYLRNNPGTPPLSSRYSSIKRSLDARLRHILELRASGYTLENIAKQLGGITRERARQLLAECRNIGPEAYNNAVGELEAFKDATQINRQPKTGINRVYIYKWLAQFGWQYCTVCSFVKDREKDFSPKNRHYYFPGEKRPVSSMCRDCSTKRRKLSYHTNPNVKAYAYAYNKAHPEHVKNWHAKNMAKAQQDPELKAQQDPELMEQIRKKRREYAHKRYWDMKINDHEKWRQMRNREDKSRLKSLRKKRAELAESARQK